MVGLVIMKDLIILFFLFALLVCCAVFLGNTVTPFCVSAILAYIFYPLVEKISTRLSINRNLVISLIVVLIISIIVSIFVIFLPILFKEINLFLVKIPIYISYIQTKLLPVISSKIEYIDSDFMLKIDKTFKNMLGSLSHDISDGVTKIISYTAIIIEIIMIIMILVPIILFYILRDWPKNFLKNKNQLISKNTLSILRKFCYDVDALLSSYMRGQFKVCVIMSIYYSVALSIIGLDLAILMGIVSGLVIILPFVGFFVSFVISMILGYFDFGFSINLFYIITTYVIGSVLEGSILTPNIIGNDIGLHPLWIIFAVLALGSMFGVLGMLFAIPIAGIVKIFISSAIDLYVKSNKQ